MRSVLLYQRTPDVPALASDLQAEGLEVLSVVCDCSNLVHEVGRHAPDAVIGTESDPDDAFFAAVQALSATAACPLVFFTSDTRASVAGRAVDAGLHAWVVNGYRADRLRPLLHVAQARFRREKALLDRLHDVTQRFEERKQIERAKGILMQARSISDDDAFQILRTASMHTNQRLGQISEQIIHKAQLADAVNRAGQLRMLSQRVVKLYLLRLADVQSRQTLTLLEQSVERIEANLAWLGKAPVVDGGGERLQQLSDTWTALAERLRGKPQARQVAEVDTLCGRLLDAAESLTADLQQAGAVASLQVLNVAGRQRMLSQRFAKVVLMHLLDADPDPAGGEAALSAVQGAFERALAYLEGLPLTSPDIRDLLGDAATAWQQMLSAAPQGRRPAGRDRVARLETVALASESLLSQFEQLSTHYERSMQMLMG